MKLKRSVMRPIVRWMPEEIPVSWIILAHFPPLSAGPPLGAGDADVTIYWPLRVPSPFWWKMVDV